MRFLLSVEISFSFEFRFVYIKFGKKLIKLVRKLIKWDYQTICYIGDEMGQLLKIENIKYSIDKLNESVQKWETSKDGKFLLRYPTVYIINDKKEKNDFEVYVGETGDIKVGQDSTSMRIQKSKHFGKNFQNQIILQCMSLDMNYLISH